MTDFESFYYKYRNLMYRIAYDILKNPQDAEDAVQEAFFNIARSLGRIKTDDLESPKSRSFAAVVTRNVCFNKLRGREITEDIEEAQIPDSAAVEEEVLSKFGVEALEKALSRLPKKYFDVLYLTAYENMSLKEAAELLGITYENAKSRIRRGRKILLSILKEESYE
ncbi:MAG: sigma-70 family RNA polymerase sigma factor [Firmicutes bacterium]|nr:sigma-70 family RNA polymerase sigma factor [[Eubacterium] siraeum]MCM1488317.1 sigma-70 family RNA polymerase sigma factor [Bacillota bacterium]